VRFADGAVRPGDRLFAAVLLAEACKIANVTIVEMAAAVEWGRDLPLRCNA
jgi:hypothetical protein